MNGIEIKFDLESPQSKDNFINIMVEKDIEKDLVYKFVIGKDGTWENLKDFSQDLSVDWRPAEEGRYIVMVQAKTKESEKPFDYISKKEFVIGNDFQRLIRNVYLEKEVLNVGEKLVVTAEAQRLGSMYRFWMGAGENWQLIKDYSPENILKYTVKNPGHQKIRVECKNLDSKENFEDSEIISFQVKENTIVEITNFICLSSELLVGLELNFQVEDIHDEDRIILYKFVKINKDGENICIQDYSTKKLVTYIESLSGDYKLLCMAKDMYSTKEYDDRAIINYKVKDYNEIVIKSLTSDLSSPQITNKEILLKALISGGNTALFRFIIEGKENIDSGYIRNNFFLWQPKKTGNYKITLWVKDSSFSGDYETIEKMSYVIDEISEEPVEITQVLADKEGRVLKGDTVAVKAIATGGNDIKYNFLVKREGIIVEKTDYGSCNWVNFIPEENGCYELEVMVKDKYSQREYEAHHSIYFQVYSFVPAVIDYILLPTEKIFLAGEKILLNVIVRDTDEVLIKYVLSINESVIEETPYVKDNMYAFVPNYPGKYKVLVYAKNKNSSMEFDSKQEIKIEVKEALPVNNTKISSDVINIKCNETVKFTVDVEGGKEIIYEFYLWNKGNWSLVQGYGRNNNYSFIAFVPDKYKILALVKSQYSSDFYEDYEIFDFSVEA